VKYFVKYLLIGAMVLALAAVGPGQANAQIEDATVTLDVTSLMYVSPHQVVVEGTLTCDQPLSGELNVVLTGRLHQGTVVPQPSGDVDPFSCSGETPFAIAVQSVRGLSFHVGQALNVNAEFIYCGATACFGVSSVANLTVQR
jgi:hypothetical protein